LGASVHTLKKITEALLVARKEFSRDVSSEKPPFMVMSGDQNAKEFYRMKRSSKYCKIVERLKYFETTLIDKNPFYEEIKSKLKSGKFLVAAYVIFLVFPSVLSFLQERVLGANPCARCDPSS
jgi:histone deacetylase complex regulatory component SIN3